MLYARLSPGNGADRSTARPTAGTPRRSSSTRSTGRAVPRIAGRAPRSCSRRRRAGSSIIPARLRRSSVECVSAESKATTARGLRTQPRADRLTHIGRGPGSSARCIASRRSCERDAHRHAPGRRSRRSAWRACTLSRGVAAPGSAPWSARAPLSERRRGPSAPVHPGSLSASRSSVMSSHRHAGLVARARACAGGRVRRQLQRESAGRGAAVSGRSAASHRHRIAGGRVASRSAATERRELLASPRCRGSGRGGAAPALAGLREPVARMRGARRGR